MYKRQPVTVVTAASGQYETTLMSEIEKSEAPTLFLSLIHISRPSPVTIPSLSSTAMT